MRFIVLLLAVLFLAWSNGANDNFKGVASLFGSETTGSIHLESLVSEVPLVSQRRRSAVRFENYLRPFHGLFVSLVEAAQLTATSQTHP